MTSLPRTPSSKQTTKRLVCRRCHNDKPGEVELYAIRLGNGTYTDVAECRSMLDCERRAQAAQR